MKGLRYIIGSCSFPAISLFHAILSTTDIARWSISDVRVTDTTHSMDAADLTWWRCWMASKKKKLTARTSRHCRLCNSQPCTQVPYSRPMPRDSVTTALHEIYRTVTDLPVNQKLALSMFIDLPFALESCINALSGVPSNSKPCTLQIRTIRAHSMRLKTDQVGGVPSQS